MLRKHTDFDADLEDLAHRVIGCCLAVHRELGAGFVEAAYARAVSSSPPRTSRSNQRRSIRSSIVANRCICTAST
jgi:PD-(D/E)XK nuclease superfamily